MDVNEQLKQEIIELSEQGLNLKEISNKLGIHHLTAMHIIKRNKTQKLNEEYEQQNPTPTKEEEKENKNYGGRNMASSISRPSNIDPVDEFWRNASKM